MSNGTQRGKCSPVLDFPVGMKHQVTIWLFFAHAFMRCSRPAPYWAWMQSVKSQIRVPKPWLIVEPRLVKGSALGLTLAIHPGPVSWILTMCLSLDCPWLGVRRCWVPWWAADRPVWCSPGRSSSVWTIALMRAWRIGPSVSRSRHMRECGRWVFVCLFVHLCPAI